MLVPVFLMVHPPIGAMAFDFLVPKLPTTSHLNELTLLIIAIVGTTIAPWQLYYRRTRRR